MSHPSPTLHPVAALSRLSPKVVAGGFTIFDIPLEWLSILKALPTDEEIEAAGFLPEE